MKVRLTTSRWDQRTPKGVERRIRGDRLTVDDDVAEWLIRSGAAEPDGGSAAPSDEPVAAPGPVAVEAAAEDTGPGAGMERPIQSAPKADWVAYAVSRGIPAKEAEAMDKQKLISRAS